MNQICLYKSLIKKEPIQANFICFQMRKLCNNFIRAMRKPRRGGNIFTD